MTVTMAVSLVSNQNLSSSNNNNNNNNHISSSPYKGFKNSISSSLPSSSYSHYENPRTSESDTDFDGSNESSSLLPLLDKTKKISIEESRLIELTMSCDSQKPILGKFPKSSSFDSSTTLSAQAQSQSQSPRYKKKSKSKIIDVLSTSQATHPIQNESESDNEYTLMLGQNYSSSLKGMISSRNGADCGDYNQNDLSNLQMPCSLLSCSNHSLANGSTPLLGGSSSTSYISLRKTPRSLSRARTTCCFRLHTYLTRSSYLNYLVPLFVLIGFLAGAYLTKDYAKRLFYWVETQNPWIIFGLFMAFFVVVSFPIVVGYFALIVTAGYLFGCLKGILTVILGANLGVAIAHFTMGNLKRFFPTQKLIKNETARAILRVISGPRAFKVVLFTRLTPIPFGLQNAIFGISTISGRIYHVATFIGLLPAQMINVYLGSTLRSMQEVLSSNRTSVMGYISIGVEIIFGAALMCWVVQKAKKELSETLISDMNENKDIDIQV